MVVCAYSPNISSEYSAFLETQSEVLCIASMGDSTVLVEEHMGNDRDTWRGMISKEWPTLFELRLCFVVGLLC